MDFYRWRKEAAAIFFPQLHCLYCGRPVFNQPLCDECEQRRLELRSCPLCANFIAISESDRYLCPECRAEHPSYQAAAAAMPYQEGIRKTLLAFKYHQQTGYRRPLAELMLRTMREKWPRQVFDAVVPVPLHTSRLQERGYNQAEMLSALIAAESGFAHQPQLLRRIRKTTPMVETTNRRRRKISPPVFAADPAVAGKRILLIDDIFTSGTTAENCTLALLEQQAAEVYLLAAAAGYALP